MSALLQVLLLSLVVLLAGCNEPPLTKERPPLTKDRFGRTAELGPEQEALTVKELAFLLRAQTSEAEITADLRRRGLAEAIDETARRQLTEAGASPRFIETLQASPLVLTEEERALYAERLAARKLAASAATSDHDRWVEESRADLSRKAQNAQSVRLDEKRRELQTKIAKLRDAQSRERYSRSNSSPYQGYAREIAEVNAEVSRLSSEIDRLR